MSAIARGREWIEGMQSRDGGWAAFDVNNLEYYLNNIPFSDHGALLDPPTEDVTARCVSMLAQLGRDRCRQRARLPTALPICAGPSLRRARWYGRWGLNYIYGTWSVLCALNAAGVGHQDPVIRKAVDWLVSIQNADGGWGEDATSYKLDYQGIRGCAQHRLANGMGLAWIDGSRRGRASGSRAWHGVSDRNTDRKRSVGRAALHGNGLSSGVLSALSWISKFFPLWALARYRNLKSTNSRVVGVGM